MPRIPEESDLVRDADLARRAGVMWTWVVVGKTPGTCHYPVPGSPADPYGRTVAQVGTAARDMFAPTHPLPDPPPGNGAVRLKYVGALYRNDEGEILGLEGVRIPDAPGPTT